MTSLIWYMVTLRAASTPKYFSTSMMSFEVVLMPLAPMVPMTACRFVPSTARVNLHFRKPAEVWLELFQPCCMNLHSGDQHDRQVLLGCLFDRVDSDGLAALSRTTMAVCLLLLSCIQQAGLFLQTCNVAVEESIL